MFPRKFSSSFYFLNHFIYWEKKNEHPILHFPNFKLHRFVAAIISCNHSNAKTTSLQPQKKKYMRYKKKKIKGRSKEPQNQQNPNSSWKPHPHSPAPQLERSWRNHFSRNDEEEAAMRRSRRTTPMTMTEPPTSAKDSFVIWVSWKASWELGDGSEFGDPKQWSLCWPVKWQKRQFQLSGDGGRNGKDDEKKEREKVGFRV